MLSLQVVFPLPPSLTYFLFHFNFNLNSNPILIPHSRCSLLARCLPRFPLALELDVPVGSISRSPRVYSLLSSVFSLQSSRRIQSTVCILHCALAVQSTKCISASSMHLLCLLVPLSVSFSLIRPSIAHIRSVSFSVVCPASAAMFAFVYLKVS